MRSKAEIEIGMAESILTAISEDFQKLDRFWPASKQGSNAIAAVESIAGRIAAALLCVQDAKSALETTP